jgi:phosphate transport system permease protein
MTTAPVRDQDTATPSKPKAVVRIGDRVFSTASVVAGSLILFVLALVAAFLVWQSIPAFSAKAGGTTSARSSSAPCGPRSWPS